jgi:coenzyme F420 hydrogenase subunit beta
MKTFTDLIQEVQERGLCHHCGGCVAFCTAINYGALELGKDGRPHYRDREKCIECGICYSICPEINELDEDIKTLVGWSAPMGRILGTATAKAADPEVQARGTDGGVVTALLLHLFDQGRIDAAIVSKKVGPFQRHPWLALSREDILEAAGFHFDTLPTIAHFSEVYSTYSPSIMELKDVTRKTLNRVAFVGTPCQINALRRMEVLGVVPSDAIKIHFGLFCAGNFQFGPEERFRGTDLYETVCLPILRGLLGRICRPCFRRPQRTQGLDHGSGADAAGAVRTFPDHGLGYRGFPVPGKPVAVQSHHGQSSGVVRKEEAIGQGELTGIGSGGDLKGTP